MNSLRLPGGWGSILGAPLLLAELLFLCKLVRHMRTLMGRPGPFGRPHTALPVWRLRRRLRYMVRKYAEHAPYWQVRTPPLPSMLLQRAPPAAPRPRHPHGRLTVAPHAHSPPPRLRKRRSSCGRARS